MINGHDIPEIAFFENKNVFTGSEGNNFRYRIARIEDEDGAKLEACVWYEDLCYELCNIAKKETFGISNEELAKAVDWIFEHKE